MVGGASPGHRYAEVTDAYNEFVVLLFEFFPAFVMLVSVVVGVWLFVRNRDTQE